MLAIELTHMKFHSDEFQQVPIGNYDADRHAGIFDHLFRHWVTRSYQPPLPGMFDKR